MTQPDPRTVPGTCVRYVGNITRWIGETGYVVGPKHALGEDPFVVWVMWLNRLPDDVYTKDNDHHTAGTYVHNLEVVSDGL